MNELLNWRRLGLVIRNDFLHGLRQFAISFVVMGIIALSNAVPAAGFGALQEGFYDRWFIGMMLIWGSVYASWSFKALGDKRYIENFLLLPASALEKTLSRYINGTVVFTLYVLVFLSLVPPLIEGINMMLFGRTNVLFNPFNPDNWRIIGIFMLIQPVFFLGGAWFRRYCWFKTVISVFLISAALGMLACLAFLIFFPEVVSGMIQGHDFVVNDDMNWYINENLFEYILIGLKVLFLGIAPPFCIYLTWLRVQETQASHGI